MSMGLASIPAFVVPGSKRSFDCRVSIEIFDRRHRKNPFVRGLESTQIAGDSTGVESRALLRMGRHRRTSDMKAKTSAKPAAKKPAAKAPAAKAPAAKAPAKKAPPKKKK
jgi:hypothetical protein